MPLEITEFRDLAYDASGRVAQVFDLPAVTNQVVAISGVSTSSAPVNGGVGIVRLVTDVACRIEIGRPATASSMKLLPNLPEYFGVPEGATINNIAA